MRSILICLLFVIYKAGAQTSALRIADSLAAVGNHTKAIVAYKKLQRESPSVLVKIARSYKAIGNDNAALDAYQRTLTLDSSQTIAATEYGRLLINQGKFRRADSVFGNLIDRYDDNPEFHYQRGRILKEIGPQVRTVSGDTMMEGAVSAFAKALKIDSTHLDALDEVGLHHLKKSEYDQVELIAQSGLNIDNENVKFVSLMAQNYANKGWHTEAIDWFEKLIALGQSTPFIHRKLGLSYAKQNFYELAIAQYTILINKKGEDKVAEHHLALARLYQRTNELDKGIRHAEIALFLLDESLEAPYYTLATLHKLKEEYQEAIQNYQLAIEENPKNIAAHYGIAVAADNYYKDKKEVLRYYKRFITQFENDASNASVYYRDLAQRRVAILTQEIFMKADKGE